MDPTIISELNSSLTWIQENIINNQYLIAVLGGGLIFYLKSILSFLSDVFKRYCIVSITVTSDNIYDFYSLELWVDHLFSKSIWKKNMELSDVLSNEYSGLKLTPANGIHFFMYNKRVYWINKTQLTNQLQKIKYIYKVSTFGLTNTSLINFFNKINHYRILYNSKDYLENKCSVFIPTDYGDWTKVAHIKHRGFDSIYLEKEIIDKIINKIRFFINNKQWYLDNHIPYKLGIILHGEPGCSKTTLIKIIASLLKTDVYSLQTLENCKQDSFISFVHEAILRSNLSFKDANIDVKKFEAYTKYGIEIEKQIPIIALEDADSFLVLRKRTSNENSPTIINKTTKFEVTLSTILNIMDGMLTPDGVIFIMTTNTINQLDPAIFRPGRIDLCLEIKPINSSLIKEMCNHFYNKDIQLNIPDTMYIVPAKLQELLMMYSDKDQLEKEIIKNKFVKKSIE